MIRGFHLADLFTLANASCGMASAFASMTYLISPSIGLFTLAAALVPLALVFDALDGRVARWRHAHSTLGRELDSLADVISFGVAPAALAFAAGMRGGWDWAVLIYFVGCGVSRLARYNVTAEALSAGGDKVKYFEGTPIPSSLGLDGPAGRGVVLRLRRAGLGRAPAGPDVRAFWQPDDQQDPANSEAVKGIP